MHRDLPHKTSDMKATDLEQEFRWFADHASAKTVLDRTVIEEAERRGYIERINPQGNYDLTAKGRLALAYVTGC